MPALPVVRRLITWVAGGVAGAVGFGVIGQWFIQVAEDKGWYAHAGQTWDRIMSGLLGALTSPIATHAAMGCVALAAGMWLDFILYRRERRPVEDSIAQAVIDRQKLADDALAVGQGICRLTAQGQARLQTASEADRKLSRQPETFSYNENRVREEAVLLDKYAEQFHAEVWRVLDLSARTLRLDQSMMWRLRNTTSIYELEELGKHLLSISNDLRFPGNPHLPLLSSEEVESLRRATLARQSPLGIGSETPL